MNSSTIHISLQEGFQKESVNIVIDGNEVYRKQDVSTRHQIGLADTVEHETDLPIADVKIHLPEKNKKASIKIHVRQNPYLGIDLDTDGNVRFKSSSRPFGFL